MPVQVHNALGFAYFNMERTELALRNYGRAVELQPGYVTAWNNLGDAQEKAKDWQKVLLLPPPVDPSASVLPAAHPCICSFSLLPERPAPRLQG